MLRMQYGLVYLRQLLLFLVGRDNYAPRVKDCPLSLGDSDVVVFFFNKKTHFKETVQIET